MTFTVLFLIFTFFCNIIRVFIPEVKAKHVVQTVLEGLREGERLYGVKVIYSFLLSKVIVFLDRALGNDFKLFPASQHLNFEIQILLERDY